MFSKELEDMANQCVKCGLCIATCPVYQEVLMEEAAPRGKVQLAKHFFRGEINGTTKFSKELANSFYTCTTCNACTSFCPSQIKAGEIIQEGREKIFASGAVPEPVMAIRDSILSTANIYAGKKEDRIAIYPASIKKKVWSGHLKKKADILLFMGCVASYLDMKIVPSLFKIMDAGGVDYTVLASEELCCGLPLYLMGDREAFRQNALNVIETIRESGAKEVVTPCAGCYKSFRKYYLEVGDLGVELHHSIHYIQKLMEDNRLRLDGNVEKRVTYHDPCDLGRSFQILEEPREILKSIIGSDLVEMEKNRLLARCCGGGGGVMALGPELAENMATARVKDAAEVGAETIVSGCSTCKDNLRKGLKSIPKDKRPKIKVMDITEIVANSIIGVLPSI